MPDLKQIADAATRASMMKKWTWRERAKIMCILNKFETPKIINMRRPLTQKEIGPMFRHFKATVSKKAFLMYWNLPSNKNNFGMELE